LVWATLVAATRYVSLASLTAAAALCAFRIAFTREPWPGPRGVVTGFCLLAAVLVAARHRANIVRLLRGEENRLKEGAAMSRLAKVLHVLAVGLWFGSAAFFTYMGVTVFGTFEQITAEPAAERPAWLPVADRYRLFGPGDPRFSESLAKQLGREQGARIAGAVVGPLFPVYFAIQAACAAIAFLTAFSWRGIRGGASSLRLKVLAVALICVLAGWVLERKVNDLRGPRDEKTDALLAQTVPGEAQIANTEAARRVFLQWHLASVLLNLVTLGLVTVAMGLVAWLPSNLTSNDPQTTAPTGHANGATDLSNASVDAPRPATGRLG
jgi:glycerol-3-phosphate acyltransferase PlsY